MSDAIMFHVDQSSTGTEVHPEELPPHRIVRSCDDVFGVPDCMGSAVYGPRRCTCTTLSAEQLDQCLIDAWTAFFDRGGEMCADCAFRKGSPEEEEIPKIADSVTPFRCHQGMPVDARPGFPMKDAYVPLLVVENGKLASDFPVCAGWLRARAALAKRAP